MDLIIIITFLAGYSLIIFEQKLKINKAASSLITGVLCWICLISGKVSNSNIMLNLNSSLSNIAGIIFFLLGSMTIVELIESHHGFDLITKRINSRNSRALLWIITWITFTLSSIMNNLTTAIVMIMIMRKLVNDSDDRIIFSGLIIIAANAGGSWSPIGDVTTSMLWISNRITVWHAAIHLIIPSIFNLLIPVLLGTLFIKKKDRITNPPDEKEEIDLRKSEKIVIFVLGISTLISVPVLNMLTGMSPYMCILLGLGVLWVITEIIHKNKNDDIRMNLSVIKALKQMDMSTLLFFLGILLAISSVESAGILTKIALWADSIFRSVTMLATAIGLFSSIIDNVPLVAATIGMYPVSVFPTDHKFWELIAYCTGTGGSILIIGSAAGVAVMGIGKIGFFNYLKKVSWMALIGYLVGIGVFSIQIFLFKQ